MEASFKSHINILDAQNDDKNKLKEEKSLVEIKTLRFLERPLVILVFFCCCSFAQGSIINGIFPSVLSTFEKRFNFRSSHSALIASSYHIGSLLFLPVLSYVGGFGKKNLWVGYGMICFGIGTAMFALPHFTTDLPAEFNNINKTLCLPQGYSEKKKCSISLAYLFYFVLLNIFNGGATAPLYSLGVVYLNENIRHPTATFYQGIFFAFSVVGVAGGYLLGGICVGLMLDTKANETDPQGAWWLAYLIAGTLTVLFAIPIILLPDKIVSIKSRNLSISVNDKREMSIKDAWSTFKFLMRNQIIVIINIVSGLDFFTFLGLNTFLAKYIAFALHMTESEAAFFVGIILVIGGVSGQVTGGWIGSKVSEVKSCVKYILGFTIIAAFFSAMLLIRSKPKDIAGFTKPYPLVAGEHDFCFNNKCNCDLHSYNPVCGADKVEYVTPCQAGCSSFQSKNRTFSNCSCLYESHTTAKSGLCEHNVGFPLRFVVLILIFCFIFCVFIGKVLQIQIVFSQIEDKRLHSFGLGIQWFFIRMFGAIPGPLCYGWVTTNACILTETTCERVGVCRLYDEKSLSLNMFLLCAVERVINSLLLGTSLFLSKNKDVGRLTRADMTG